MFAANNDCMLALLLNNNGTIKRSTSLCVEGEGNIFVVGDAGCLQGPKGTTADDLAIYLMSSSIPHKRENRGTKRAEMMKCGLAQGSKGWTGQFGDTRLPSPML